MFSRDFDVRSLASYLHLTPAQVSRLADRGRLPGRKVAGEWRFAQAAIHHWLEEKIGISNEGELLHVEDVLVRAERRSGSAERAVSISDMLPRNAIAVPLKARTRRAAIVAMVELAAGTGLLWDPEKMVEAVRAREDLHPTALDNGVALLHPRRPMAALLAEPLLALGRTHQGIPFGAQGAVLTDVFFLICSMEDRGHLRVLARLSRLLADSTFLAGLRELDEPDAIHGFIAAAEAVLEG